jgi:hypothetical protein
MKSLAERDLEILRPLLERDENQWRKRSLRSVATLALSLCFVTVAAFSCGVQVSESAAFRSLESHLSDLESGNANKGSAVMAGSWASRAIRSLVIAAEHSQDEGVRQEAARQLEHLKAAAQ